MSKINKTLSGRREGKGRGLQNYANTFKVVTFIMVIFGLPEPEAPMSTNRIFEGCGLTSAPAQGIFCVDASLSLSLQ